MSASVYQFKARVAGTPLDEEVAAPLAEDLRRSFEAHARALLERFFDVADDRLFDYGGRSGGEGQAAYLQAMRGLRNQRQDVRDGYTRTIAEQLQPSWRPHVVARSDGDKSLRLIEDHIVEQRLALETTRQRIENDCGEALYGFRQRLEGARRQHGLQLIEGQFSPLALCTALYQGLRPVVGEFDLLVVLLKIFEQVARVQLQDIYEQLNMLMDASGVAFGDSRGGAGSEDKPAAEKPVQDNAAPTAAPAATAIAAIRELAANVAALGPLLGQSAGAPAQHPFDQQLEQALRSAQEPAAPAWTQAVALRAAAGAWLFDELLGDVQVAARLRQELGGLRAPLVRASLQEDRFLSDVAHPLRQLVQDLSALAVTAKLGRGEEISGIRDMIHELGARLQRNAPRRDLQTTAEVDEETLQGFAQAVREAAQLRRDRLVQRARELAVDAVDRGVQKHLAGVELPECVSLALEKAFGPLLGLILLRRGPAAEAYTEAQGLLDEFLGTLAKGPANGAAAAPPQAELGARLTRAAAGMGFSAGRQDQLRALLDAALRSAPLPPDGAGAEAAREAAGFCWEKTPGMEVAEVSETDLRACAADLFTPGSWFRARSADGPAELRWMQVERCDTGQDQVLFRGLLGAAPVARPLQRLLFEVLCGECQHISSNLRSALAVARLARAFGMEAA